MTVTITKCYDIVLFIKRALAVLSSFKSGWILIGCQRAGAFKASE